ncbi:MAG: hypothetical protein ACO3CQ_07420 [Candidatus Nanopelagicaceae bacterium]
MGLDMYLSARKHVEKIDWNKLDRSNGIDYSAATFPQWNDVVNAAGVATLVDEDSIYGVDVSVNVAYWRKSNQIHNWFVINVQRGEDDCGEYYVSHNKLKELLDTCREALSNKDPNLLPPREGFFFGSTDVDEWYWADIKDTIKQLDNLVNLPDFERLSFYYQSSW